jgi:DNA adenine methylase
VYGKFTFDDHKRLAESLLRADKKGVKWAMTTSSHKDILQLFDSWDIMRITRGTGQRIGILANNSDEALIKNYYFELRNS